MDAWVEKMVLEEGERKELGMLRREGLEEEIDKAGKESIERLVREAEAEAEV